LGKGLKSCVLREGDRAHEEEEEVDIEAFKSNNTEKENSGTINTKQRDFCKSGRQILGAVVL
jgi:hypothetical protein